MNMVKIVNNEPMTTTIIIADGMKLKHRAIMVLVDKYKDRLETHGFLTFEMRKTLDNGQGRPTRFAWLNESQTVFLITLMRNSDIVVKFKDELTKEFFRQRKLISTLLTQRQNASWMEQRNQGKLVRVAETDTIKEFTRYCKMQGSEHADMYYANISKMENRSLFLLEQKFPNVRDVLSGYQLSIIASADIVVSKALKYGMGKSMHYTEIYKMAKARVEQFAELVGKTNVPMISKEIEAPKENLLPLG